VWRRTDVGEQCLRDEKCPGPGRGFSAGDADSKVCVPASAQIRAAQNRSHVSATAPNASPGGHVGPSKASWEVIRARNSQ
jgi:hypothetical protein